VHVNQIEVRMNRMEAHKKIFEKSFFKGNCLFCVVYHDSTVCVSGTADYARLLNLELFCYARLARFRGIAESTARFVGWLLRYLNPKIFIYSTTFYFTVNPPVSNNFHASASVI